VALRAYFDESGTHWGGPCACDIFVLCGYVAPESLWDEHGSQGFLSKWDGVMHGKPFHATEMESNPQGQTVKIELANVANSSGIIGVGGSIHIPSYKRLLAPYIRANKITSDPYLFLFGDVILEAVERSAMFLSEDQQEPIGFVFANHDRWSSIAPEMYNEIRNDPRTPPDVRPKLGSVAFEDISKIIPLQAADHLAYETYRSMNDPPGTRRRAMNVLMRWPQNHGRYYDERGLLLFIDRCKSKGTF